MKSISWIILFVSAALVLAGLDTQPDPPAVNPNTAICKVLKLHNYASESATPVLCDSCRQTPLFPENTADAVVCESCLPSDRTLLTGQASDPSPPAIQIA